MAACASISSATALSAMWRAGRCSCSAASNLYSGEEGRSRVVAGREVRFRGGGSAQGTARRFEEPCLSPAPPSQRTLISY